MSPSNADGGENTRSPELKAIVGFVDRSLVVARLREPWPMGDVRRVARTLASAEIVAASPAALRAGAAPGAPLGTHVDESSLRSAALVRADEEGSPCIVLEHGPMAIVVLTEPSPTPDATREALHREARRWSHDLANSLMAVTGHAQLLRRHLADGDSAGQRSLDRILEAVEKASASMSERVKSLARPDP